MGAPRCLEYQLHCSLTAGPLWRPHVRELHVKDWPELIHLLRVPDSNNIHSEKRDRNSYRRFEWGFRPRQPESNICSPRSSSRRPNTGRTNTVLEEDSSKDCIA